MGKKKRGSRCSSTDADAGAVAAASDPTRASAGAASTPAKNSSRVNPKALKEEIDAKRMYITSLQCTNRTDLRRPSG